jgi:hypothetical protein
MARDASPDEHVIVDEEIEDTDVVSSEAEDSESEDEPTSGENADPAEDSEPDPLPDESGQQEEPDDEAATAGQAPAAAASTGTKKSEPQPFTYKGDKTEHTLEGAHYYAGDGLYIPEPRSRVKQLFRDWRYPQRQLAEERARVTRQIEQVAPRRAERKGCRRGRLDGSRVQGSGERSRPKTTSIDWARQLPEEHSRVSRCDPGEAARSTESAGSRREDGRRRRSRRAAVEVSQRASLTERSKRSSNGRR